MAILSLITCLGKEKVTRTLFSRSPKDLALRVYKNIHLYKTNIKCCIFKHCVNICYTFIVLIGVHFWEKEIRLKIFKVAKEELIHYIVKVFFLISLPLWKFYWNIIILKIRSCIRQSFTNKNQFTTLSSSSRRRRRKEEEQELKPPRNNKYAHNGNNN